MKNKKQKQNLLNPTHQMIFAVLLFLISIMMSRGEVINPLEHGAFFAIYKLPDFLFLFFYIITQLGSVYVLGLMSGFFVYTKRYNAVLRMLITGALSYLLAGLGKDLLGRSRPHEFFPEIITLDVIRGAGFPSGHMALATALAMVLGHYLPRKYYPIPIIWIVGVGLSRLYLGAHLPLDVVGGFAIGWFSYALVRHVNFYPAKSSTIKRLDKNLVDKKRSVQRNRLKYSIEDPRR